ncbi:unnamed protein product [Strongylus vulgaris]|uniref:Secreted protein n=1 Tax=Strongylus vulgaris TaxID=40348 RepID=A0A3P7KUU8_STRVU|nr:unnamed protein product [Strongylus vulgaris]
MQCRTFRLILLVIALPPAISGEHVPTPLSKVILSGNSDINSTGKSSKPINGHNREQITQRPTLFSEEDEYDEDDEEVGS